MKGIWGNRIEGIKDVGFDTIIHGMFCWKSHSERAEILEAAARDSIQVIPILHTYYRDNNISGAVDLVNAWKNHPAIAGWFGLDEPELNKISVAEQRKFYGAIKTADPSHPFYSCWMAQSKNLKYYADDVCDVCMVNHYPIIRDYGWRIEYIDYWIESTRNRDIIPIMQGFSRKYPNAEYLDPSGTIAEQYDIWKERRMTNRGYTIYQWETTNGDGVVENPAVLKEVKIFNESVEEDGNGNGDGGNGDIDEYDQCAFCNEYTNIKNFIEIKITGDEDPTRICKICKKKADKR